MPESSAKKILIKMKNDILRKGNIIYGYIGFDSLAINLPVTSLRCTFTQEKNYVMFELKKKL